VNIQELRLARPNTMVRLGIAKIQRIKRAQDLVEIIAFATVVFVTASFLLDGGLTGLTDVPSILGALSRLTALVATDLLLIQTMLIARVPWLDRLYGHDRATIAHKKLGKPVLYIVIVHFLASLTQYAIQEGKNIAAEVVSMATSSRDLLLSLISLAAMIGVVITSIKIARAKLSYEAWYLVHLLGYVSIILAVPHEFSTGQDIMGKPLQTAFWIALYAFVAGNVLWFRFMTPVLTSMKHRFAVTRVAPESSDTSSIYIGGVNMHKLNAQAGQFYLVRIMTPTQWWRPHPFSLSAAPNGEYLRFTIGNRGDDTAKMLQLKPGTRVILEGPYGIFTEDRRTKEKVTLIAAGIGVPPIRALAESMAAKPGDITVVYRTRKNEDAALLRELAAIADHRGHTLRVLEGPRAHAASWLPAGHGNIPDYQRVKLVAPQIHESDIFICGPVAWTHSVERSLKQLGIKPEQIHAEEFAW
jgi:predicted ferric reductase